VPLLLCVDAPPRCGRSSDRGRDHRAARTRGAGRRHARGTRGLRLTRTIKRAGGYHAARGTEVTLRFDERAFEGSGVFLLGAVLDRFLAEYASINSFTQIVITSDQRGKIMTWPARTGSGPLL
jgi:type VI secretion system protein ImpG